MIAILKSKTVILMLMLSAFGAIQGQKVELEEETTVTNEGLYFWYPNGKKAFDFAPNISPRGDCFTVNNGYIFFGWYKGGMNKRNLMISRKKIGSGKWIHVQLPHTNTLINERFKPTPYPNGLGNSHQTVSVGISNKDNTIHIFYDHHNDPLNYIVSKKGKAFVPDNQFNTSIFERTRDNLAPGQKIKITYPELTENDKGDLIVNYRVGTSHAGEETVHSYNGTWTRSKVISTGRPPKVPQNKSNYAYGTPVFANGQFYYTFSVRWDADRSAINEGIYLAKCGSNFTSDWEDLKGNKHKLPIKDFSPFLVDDPATENGGGATAPVTVAVSDDGDVHLSYKGRGRNSRYFYSYVRKAGDKNFVKRSGFAKTGVAWKDRIYNVTTGGNGIITVESTPAGSINYRQDLRFDSKKSFGNSEVRIVDGKIVVIVEDRKNKNTDKQPIYCYVFKIGNGGTIDPPNNQPPTVNLTSPVNNSTFQLGDEITFSANASDPNGNLEKVNFLINNTFHQTDASRPFSSSFTPEQAGTYEIIARAIDRENAKTDAKVTITVLENNLAPTATFSTPTESTIEEGYSKLVVTVDASDPNGDDFRVLLKINGQDVRSESVAPYEWGHAGSPNPSETVDLSVGDHVFEAIVTDERGLSTTISKTITVTERVVTSTNATLDSEELSLYPNPSQDGLFHMSTSNKWSVYNYQGILITSGDGSLIDLKNQPKGIYLLSVNEKIMKLVY